MSQQTPQERNLQPIPAWMLKDEEKTGGNAGAGGEETPSPAQTQEPEHTPRALPERKAVVPSPKPPVVSREEVQLSARGKDVLMRVVVGAILGAIIGVLVAYASGVSPIPMVRVVVGGSIGAVVCGVIAFRPSDAWSAWDALDALVSLVVICSTVARPLPSLWSPASSRSLGSCSGRACSWRH